MTAEPVTPVVMIWPPPDLLPPVPDPSLFPSAPESSADGLEGAELSLAPPSTDAPEASVGSPSPPSHAEIEVPNDDDLRARALQAEAQQAEALRLEARRAEAQREAAAREEALHAEALRAEAEAVEALEALEALEAEARRAPRSIRPLALQTLRPDRVEALRAAAAFKEERARQAAADWRQTLVDGIRTPGKGSMASPPIAELLRCLSLPLSLEPALQLLYGAHLIGQRGAAAAAVAEALVHLDGEARWREALGAGQLAAAGLVALRGSQLRLTGVVRRVLDRREPRFGVVLGGGGSPPDVAAALVYEHEASPEELGRAASALLGCPVLVIEPLTEVAELRLAALEARLRGAVVAVPYPWPPRLPAGPALYLTPYRGDAEAAGLPVLELPPPGEGLS